MSSLVRVKEREDAFVKLTLKDEAGTELAAAAVNSITWTLFDEETGSVINSRSGVSESPITSPHFIHLTPDDNVVVTASKRVEVHVLEYLVGYNSDRGTGLSHRGRIEIEVENLTKVA